MADLFVASSISPFHFRTGSLPPMTGVLISINEMAHDLVDMYIYSSETDGQVQRRIPSVRRSEMTPAEWSRVPHIRSICEYARARFGFLSYYWPKSLEALHTTYMNWFHTIPADSSLHESADYAHVFVELHLRHFHSGPTGWIENTFRF